MICGFTQSFGNGSSDYYLVKLNFNGDTLWTKTYGGAGIDEAYSISQTPNGDFLILGRSDSFGSGDTDIYLIKVDSNGNQLWTKSYGGPGQHTGFECISTYDLGHALIGYSYSDYSTYLIRTDMNGDTLWTQKYNVGQSHGESRIKETSDNGFIISNTISVSGNYEAQLIKTNSVGAIIWETTIGDVGIDYAMDVIESGSGDFVVTGLWQNTVNFEFDLFLASISNSGDHNWTELYGGLDSDFGVSLDHLSDGGYVVCGGTDSYGMGSSDVYLLKTNNSGFVGLIENEPKKERTITKIYDSLGRETIMQPNKPLIVVFSDGTSRKIFQLD